MQIVGAFDSDLIMDPSLEPVLRPKEALSGVKRRRRGISKGNNSKNHPSLFI